MATRFSGSAAQQAAIAISKKGGKTVSKKKSSKKKSSKKTTKKKTSNKSKSTRAKKR